MRYGARKRKFLTSRRTGQLNNSKRSESKTKSPIHYTKNRIETNIRTKKNKQKPIESLDPIHCLILRRWECQSHDQIRKEINTFEIVHKKGHIPIALLPVPNWDNLNVFPSTTLINPAPLVRGGRARIGRTSILSRFCLFIGKNFCRNQ